MPDKGLIPCPEYINNSQNLIIRNQQGKKDTQMLNQHLKNAQHHEWLGKCKFKPP